MSGESATRAYYETNAAELAELWAGHLHHGIWRPGQEHLTKQEAAAALVELLARAAALPTGARVLDLGCGSGGTCIQLCLSSPTIKCVGVNFCEAQVRLASEAATVAGVADRAIFVCADACALPITEGGDGTDDSRGLLCPGSFDSVWMLESLSQFPDRLTALRSAARLLRSGGTVAIADWMRGEAPGAPPGESTQVISTIERMLSGTLDDEASLRGLLRSVGFAAGEPAATGDGRLPDRGSPAPPLVLPYWEDVTPFCDRTWAWAWGDLLRPAFWWLLLRQLPSAWASLEIARAMALGRKSGAFRVGVLVARLAPEGAPSAAV